MIIAFLSLSSSYPSFAELMGVLHIHSKEEDKKSNSYASAKSEVPYQQPFSFNFPKDHSHSFMVAVNKTVSHAQIL